MRQTMMEASGFKVGQPVVMHCQSSGDDHEGNFHDLAPGAPARIDSIERFDNDQGVAFTLVIETGKTDGHGDVACIVNVIDELDGDPRDFFGSAS